MSQKPILSACQLSKTYYTPHKVEVLKSVSLELYPNMSIAIIGASGEGKSTLLHILGTLDNATGGELYIAGKSASKTPLSELRNKHVGFIFQFFNLLEDYTVLQNVLMPALIAKRAISKGSTAYVTACSLLEKMGLQDRIHFTTKLLSGGEKQRVCLARALLNDPEIILADEPSGNLDHETSILIHELLLQPVKEWNKSLIVVTHDMELANLCDVKLRLSDGMLINCH